MQPWQAEEIIRKDGHWDQLLKAKYIRLCWNRNYDPIEVVKDYKEMVLEALTSYPEI